ncbi:serine threonine phosphatase 6 regulatory ankyrin repeat subunit A [Fusarium heterosporum]|uniref:Serine threonine phosphatase 6 regulatory ankyrin repeat subunit A n=1 Tax=Fusarium heterosporum TaxID=42747 RepID=A0A8H5SUB0_FUSHE|nr:serine threonine phosphatase 6 regulatory ankyrin repeat subunit A [Fusarium heterosporum]
MTAINNPPPQVDFTNFEYTNLPSPSSIRLLSIIKRPRQLSLPSILGEQLFECVLETIDINQAPEFDIISLTAENPSGGEPGDIDDYGPVHRYPIAVNGKLMFLRRNIYEALQMAREVNDPVETCTEDDNQTKLIHAAAEGRLQDVEECLRQGAQVHAQDCYGKTAIHCAAENGSFDIISVLLDHGASMKVLDSAGRTPMDCLSYAKTIQWNQVADMAYRLQQDPEQRELVPAPPAIRVGKPMWIDAICINNNSSAERDHHASMISQVYSRATSVVGWTGIMSENHKLTRQAISTFLRIKSQETTDDAMSDIDNSSDLYFSDIPLSNEALQDLEACVHRFLSRSWFGRPELYHEVAFGRPISVYWGLESIPLSDILQYLRNQTSRRNTSLPLDLPILSLLGSSAKKRRSYGSGGDQKRSRRDRD